MSRTGFDVVVVGARCAGSPLATHLAQAGLSVAVVDRFATPGETASTHILQAHGVACLGRLGIVDEVLASGAPWITHARIRIGEISATVPWPTRPADPGPQLCVRRSVLDPVLLWAATQAGADVYLGTTVKGLIFDGVRVVGVRAERDGETIELRAPLVVGADGRASAVARLVGARRYNVVPNQRFACWGYFEGAAWEPPATLVTQRWDDQFVVSCPADSGLYLVIVYPPLSDLEGFRADVNGSFDTRVAACPPVAGIIAGAHRVGRLSTMTSYEGFFRTSAGPGWTLVGDAGHFKDPAPGQGISDALSQAERLGGVIVENVGRPAVEADRALRAWWHSRDRDEAEMHWFAADMGAAGAVPLVLSEIVRALSRTEGGLHKMFDVFNHRVRPSQVLTAPRLASAAVSLVRRGAPLGAIRGELRQILREQLRRQYRNRRPAYAPN